MSTPPFSAGQPLPIRQIGLGVSKFTHEEGVQKSQNEDPKMLAYEAGSHIADKH